MKRLKATDRIGTFTLFQETYHRWEGVVHEVNAMWAYIASGLITSTASMGGCSGLPDAWEDVHGVAFHNQSSGGN